MITDTENIFNNIPSELDDELFQILAGNENVRIEKIVSESHSSPPGFWYDQNETEFVILLSGSAKILFEDNSAAILKPGDYLIIPPHRKHRVEYTAKDEKSVWLAVFF